MIGLSKLRAPGALLSLALFSTAALANPICQDPDSDPDGDGWGWENGESCIVDDTNSGGGTPICQDAGSDPDGDGWGWENGESCIVDETTSGGNNGGNDGGNSGGSNLPSCEEADSDPDGDGWGWENGESCVVDDTTPTSGNGGNTGNGGGTGDGNTGNGGGSCVVTQHSDWAGLPDDCTDITLQGHTIYGTLELDENTFANVSSNTEITIRNGTIDGGGQTCLQLNRGNVRLDDIEVTDCRYGIRVEASSNRSSQNGSFVFQDIDVVGTSNHGIYLGDHNGGAIQEDVTISNAHIEDIGVDGIAGDVGSNSTVRITGGTIARVDQNIKNQLNGDLWQICDPGRTRSDFMGDCVHLQRVQGHVIVDGTTCDHSDMPTKNGFIIQNQGNAPLDGHIEVHNSTVTMNNACEFDYYFQSPPSRDPKGIQLDRIQHIEVTNTTIQSAYIGLSVNNGWNTCDLDDLSIGTSAGGPTAGTNGCTIDGAENFTGGNGSDLPSDSTDNAGDDPEIVTGDPTDSSENDAGTLDSATASELDPGQPTPVDFDPTAQSSGCSTVGHTAWRWTALGLACLGFRRRSGT